MSLNHEDEALWDAVTRTVRAYRRDEKIRELMPPEAERSFVLPPQAPKERVRPTLSPQVFEETADKNLVKRLRRGQLIIQGRLDLHGMTQTQAHRILTGFLRQARDEGKRCILIITGKGRQQPGAEGEPGVLKTQLPLWLQEVEFAPYIASISVARPEDGGQGAYYILLRRHRP